MKHRMIAILTVVSVSALGLAACSALQGEPTVDPDQLATTVSETMAAVPPRALPTEVPPEQPTDTPLPSPVPSDTPLPPTEVPPTETATVAPTPTLPSTASPMPTGTLQASDPRASLGNPTWRDPFNSGTNWPMGEDDFTAARIEEGQLVMIGRTNFDGWRLTWPEIQDFYLEVTAKSGTCSGTDHYGLIARVPDRTAADRGYLFGVTCDGRYSLRTWDGETMTSLVPRTANSAILSGSEKVNRLGLWVDGEQLILYVNGVRLTEVQDSAFTAEGSFGIFVGARQTENLTVFFDEIAYWAIP